MKVVSLLAKVRVKGLASRRRASKPVVAEAPAYSEMPRREMMEAGDRLLLALKLENEASRLCSRNRKDELLLAQWKLCRESVEQFSEDYTAAIRAYRIAV